MKIALQKKHLLIAMPSLHDNNFEKSVIYLHDHNDFGSMGLIINKPLDIKLGNLLHHVNIAITDTSTESLPVYLGGPVGQDQGFVLYETNKNKQNELVLSASKDILKQIAQGHGPKNYIVTLGYAGWSAGQLAKEIQRNDWLIAPLNRDIIFSTPIAKRWQVAAELIGIDIKNLSDQYGHA